MTSPRCAVTQCSDGGHQPVSANAIDSGSVLELPETRRTVTVIACSSKTERYLVRLCPSTAGCWTALDSPGANHTPFPHPRGPPSASLAVATTATASATFGV